MDRLYGKEVKGRFEKCFHHVFVSEVSESRKGEDYLVLNLRRGPGREFSDCYRDNTSNLLYDVERYNPSRPGKKRWT